MHTLPLVHAMLVPHTQAFATQRSPCPQHWPPHIGPVVQPPLGAHAPG